ncbi:MAG: hypothetical protein ACKOCQ_02670 [Candidatus Nitrosotenuis sp.]
MDPVVTAQVGCVAVVVGALGNAVTVTVAVVVAFEQPPVPVTVYVITEVPAATAATAPVEALIVATEVVAEDQLPPVTEEDSVDEPLEQIAVVPEMVPADGAAVTVTVLVAVALAQPPVPVTVYVIVAVPAATPVTTPVDELTVAIEALLVVQAPPETVEVNVEVAPTQIPCVPDSVPAEGTAVTVTVAVVVALAQPPLPVTV